MSGILFIFHCASNTGYAIKSLESSFIQASESATRLDRVFFAYPDISNGNSEAIPKHFNNVIQFNPATRDKDALASFAKTIRNNKITVIFGFDQPVSRPYYRAARNAGVNNIISYWGAPISSLNSGVRLWFKKLDVALHRFGPDLYIFESKAMSASATHGRGIPGSKVKTIYLGVETERYQPMTQSTYAHDGFNIPRGKKIVFYSGHMEPRKGVAVIMAAANQLLDKNKREDLHFLLMGNQPGQERVYIEMLTKKARENVTFGGYRNDIDKILPGCYAGCIASTGWDSFTMSALEMASCGLPLIVSNLQGLAETVVQGETGFQFNTGDHNDLSDKLTQLLDNSALRQTMSTAARARVVDNFSKQVQVKKISAVLRESF